MLADSCRSQLSCSSRQSDHPSQQFFFNFLSIPDKHRMGGGRTLVRVCLVPRKRLFYCFPWPLVRTMQHKQWDSHYPTHITIASPTLSPFHSAKHVIHHHAGPRMSSHSALHARTRIPRAYPTHPPFPFLFTLLIPLGNLLTVGSAVGVNGIN